MSKIYKATHEGIVNINNKDIEFSAIEKNIQIIKLNQLSILFEIPTKKLQSYIFKISQNDNKNLTSVIYFKNLQNVILEGFNIKIISILMNTIDTNRLNHFFIKNHLKQFVLKKLNYPFISEYRQLTDQLPKYTENNLISRIPINFYIELFRLNGWEFNKQEIKKRPSLIVKWVDTLIFKRLDKKEVNNVKTKSLEQETHVYKYTKIQEKHEIDTGNKKLNIYLLDVLFVFYISISMKEAWEKCRKIDIVSQLEESPYFFNEKGYSIEPIDTFSLSSFNKKLKLALNYGKDY